MITVKQLMSSSVVSVTLDDTLDVVKDTFDKTHFHHLLVIVENKLLGIISDRDLLKALNPKVDSITATTKDLACLNKKAHQIMSREPITLPYQASVYDAIDIFNQHKISCIPILDDAHCPVGILSWRDILSVLSQSSKSKTC